MIKVQHVALDSLRPDPANPRRISDDELEALTRSIREFGLVDPIIARHDDRIVIGGHQRLLAARKLGLKTVPVIFVDLPPEKAHLLSLALNKISGTWDQELLARLLADLQDIPAVDLSLTGFSEEELGELLRSLDAREKRDRPEAFDLDAALEAARAAPVAKRGDLWLLGDHRLLCGDATKTEDVQRLMGEVTIELVLTDPPYGINIVRGLGAIGGAKPFGRVQQPGGRPAGVLKGKVGRPSIVEPRIYAPVHGDDKPFDPTPLLSLGAHQIIFGGIYFCQKLPEGTCWLCWDKNIAPEATFSAFELAWTSYKGRHRIYRHTWSGMVRQGPRAEELRDRVHPTQKPVGLFSAILDDFTEAETGVLDPYLGSGTTLIAAERLGRRCYGMEIEPQYIDVVIRRWEEFTGRKAEKVAN